MPDYASARNLINGNTRRVSGLEFSQDNRTLLFDYTGDSWTMSKHSGYVYGWGFNPGSIGSSTTYYNNIGLQLAIRFNFRDPGTGGAIDITDSNAKNLVGNVLEGMTGVGQVGDVTPPFTVTRMRRSARAVRARRDQVFHVKFRSANGDFQYYRLGSHGRRLAHVRRQHDGRRHHIAGRNVRKPYEAFKAHGTGVSFEQFEYRRDSSTASRVSDRPRAPPWTPRGGTAPASSSSSAATPHRRGPPRTSRSTPSMRTRAASASP